MVHRGGNAGGFSLVELSIVLVILGLLVGGVLSGQALIRASELRSVTTEYQKYSAAIGTFRDKYFAIPGDMPNATSFWGTLGQGNGNGQLNESNAVGTNEISLFWAHFSSAQMIEGSYTPICCGLFVPGVNDPRAKLNNGVWNVLGLGTVTNAGVASVTHFDTPDPTTYFAGNYGNMLMLSAPVTTAVPSGILKAEEAWNIDKKVDDGKPDQGSIVSLEAEGKSDGSGCSDQNTSTSALAASSYSLANTAASVCALIFKTGY